MVGVSSVISLFIVKGLRIASSSGYLHFYEVNYIITLSYHLVLEIYSANKFMTKWKYFLTKVSHLMVS
jgi:hypothetical protein